MLSVLFGTYITLCAAQVEIRFEGDVYQINRLKELRGTSIHWVDDGDGLKLSRSTSATRFNDSLISSLHYNVLRLPGGYLTRWFNWEKAAGDRYGADRNYGGKIEPVKSGLKEMKQFALKHSMKVMYTLTLSDPPEKIRRLIETWNELEPKGKLPIEWFELGNEDYDADSSVGAAQRYSDKAEPLISVIRQTAPNAKIGAIVANPIAPSWDTTVFNSLYNRVDFLIWHRYVPYTDYYEPDSYQKTIASFEQITKEAEYLRRMMKAKELPIYLTEYNLSFYGKDKKHQNVVLEPRYNLLLGNFVPFAYMNRVSGLVKFTLSSSGYHMFADINFIGNDTGQLSTSGIVSKYLNQWIEGQDSVAVSANVLTFSPWEFSVLKGKGPLGESCLIQNHTSKPLKIRFTGSGIRSCSSLSLFQHGATMWTERKKDRSITGEITVEPYSLNFFEMKNK